MKTKLAFTLTWIRTQLATSEVARHVATAVIAFALGAILF
jgi:hypothetical protein